MPHDHLCGLVREGYDRVAVAACSSIYHQEHHGEVVIGGRREAHIRACLDEQPDEPDKDEVPS